MALPAASFFANGPTVGNGQTALDDMVAFAKQMLGGADETELTIATGSITIAGAQHTVDTESDAATDTLTNADMSGMDGYLVLLRAENAARVVTITHEAGGAGQFSFTDGADFTLATDEYVLLWYDSGASPTTLREVARFGGDVPTYGSLTVEGNATATTISSSSTDFSNKVQVEVFDTNGVASGVTPDHTNDHLTIGATGVYEITASISFSGGSSDTISFAFFKNNGATQLGARLTRKLGTGGDVGNSCLLAIVSLTAADTVELWVQNEDDTDDVTVQDATITVKRL